MPDSVAQAIVERIKADDPTGARVLLDGVDAMLSTDARAEWRQKIGWSFYIENDDANARLMALSATEGSGPWVAEALWTAGLASWRMDDCMAAADSFQKAALQASNPNWCLPPTTGPAVLSCGAASPKRLPTAASGRAQPRHALWHDGGRSARPAQCGHHVRPRFLRRRTGSRCAS
jgi:hypothetical protein